MQKVKLAERRAFPRFSTNVPVQIVRPDAFCSQPIAATVQDISQGGVSLLTTVSIPEGEWIVIQPDVKGAGFGSEVVAIVQRSFPESSAVKLACRFPQPLDYSILRLFK